MVKTGNIGVEIGKALPALMAEMSNASNSKEGYGYKYAPLNEILDAVRPILAKHKFSLSQFVGNQEGQVTVTTALIHTSGEFIQSTMALPLADVKGTNEVQKMGASITYARRYMITSILGIAGEEDVDGNVRPTRQQAPKQAPKKTRDWKAETANATKMIDALIDKNSDKMPDNELSAMLDEYGQIKAQPDDEQKYQALRGFYSNVNNFIKGL